MRVFALVGPSGTGKSHRAISLAAELHCQIIIDDGLLIEDNRILIGTSAKRAPTRIGAIKTALFHEPGHRLAAREILNTRFPQNILILGTSEGMVKRIAQNLGLPLPERIVQINEIASTKEIRKARYNRTQLARHVVPASTLEVRKTLGGSLIDPVKVFFRQKGERRTWTEQSVVRPTFTSLGSLSISSPAVIKGVTHHLLKLPGIANVGKLTISRKEDGIVLNVVVSVVYGYHLPTIGREIQQRLYHLLDNNIGVSVLAINVYIEKLVFKST
ncbi:MAG: Asp23/Gls24 family envelope stress response protein [Heliobacteriaceae bacterium]|nr:Asp23/Gls24 family envelope stress response protein [Heliobacteriaceae bacterium]MDD4588515.1 Asp23/Gls24 family envelope stress response protein [Heliobacteriaceae bacterium]